jgi:hypothetical protein
MPANLIFAWAHVPAVSGGLAEDPHQRQWKCGLILSSLFTTVTKSQKGLL